MRLRFGWMSGGAGILLSRSVVEYLIENLYTSKQCPFDWFNDKTIAVCTKTKEDAIHVHSTMFNAWKLDSHWEFHKKMNLPILRDLISFHYAFGKYDMQKAYNCLRLADEASTEIISSC
jgi:hypothetical protein